MVEILSDKQREADLLVQRGIELLEDEKNPQEAHQIFMRAYEMDPSSARAASWVGLTYALVERKVVKGLEFCHKAIQSNIPDVMFFRNIGKVYLQQNNKRAAIGAFAKGLQIDKTNKYIMNEWKALGFRRKPFLGFLDRSHFLNVFVGKLTWKYTHSKKQTP